MKLRVNHRLAGKNLAQHKFRRGILNHFREGFGVDNENIKKI
jgi:hypothetical protein